MDYPREDESEKEDKIMPQKPRERTQDLHPDDVIRYDSIEVQAKNHGWPRNLTKTLSEMTLSAGTVKILKESSGKKEYIPLEVFAEEEGGEEEEEEEYETIDCWHPEQAKCPWDNRPFSEHPYRPRKQ